MPKRLLAKYRLNYQSLATNRYNIDLTTQISSPPENQVGFFFDVKLIVYFSQVR